MGQMLRARRDLVPARRDHSSLVHVALLWRRLGHRSRAARAAAFQQRLQRLRRAEERRQRVVRAREPVADGGQREVFGVHGALELDPLQRRRHGGGRVLAHRPRAHQRRAAMVAVDVDEDLAAPPRAPHVEREQAGLARARQARDHLGRAAHLGEAVLGRERHGRGEQAHGPVGHERQEVIGDLEVVVDEVALGDADVGPQHLVEMVEQQPPLVQLEHARRRAHEARLPAGAVAGYRPTGMVTRPKVSAPFQTGRTAPSPPGRPQPIAHMHAHHAARARRRRSATKRSTAASMVATASPVWTARALMPTTRPIGMRARRKPTANPPAMTAYGAHQRPSTAWPSASSWRSITRRVTAMSAWISAGLRAIARSPAWRRAFCWATRGPRGEQRDESRKDVQNPAIFYPKSCEGTTCASRGNGSTRAARTDITPSCICKIPSTSKNGSLTSGSRRRAKRPGVTMTFAIPVSSSRLRNTKPFAVPGRWRTITLPATRTRAPSSPRARSIARVTPRAASAARRSAIGCGPSVTPVPA